MDEEWVEYDGGAVQDRHRSAHRIRVAPGVSVIPERAFQSCHNLRAVDLSNVTIISDYAFNKCFYLEHVVWSTASAVEIGKWAFRCCISLMKAINLSHVTKIGEGAFGSCKNLAEVELSEGIQRIGREAFWICESLTHVTIPSSVTAIEPAAFLYCTNLTEVELGEGMQRIGRGSFRDCSNLVRINIPPSVTDIGDGAFGQCYSLVEADLCEGLQAIGPRAFAACRSLERITIPSSVTLIGWHAFQNCNNLSEVTLREGVHCIARGAFKGCTSLRHINIPPVAFVIDIEDSSCQLMRVTMPKPNWRGRKLVVSKWMQYRSPDELEQAEAKVNEILGSHQHTVEGQYQCVSCIYRWFKHYYLVDVATMLELAIWRVNMDGNEQHAEARQAIRKNCGNDMNVIIPCVLQFCSP